MREVPPVPSFCDDGTRGFVDTACECSIACRAVSSELCSMHDVPELQVSRWNYGIFEGERLCVRS